MVPQRGEVWLFDCGMMEKVRPVLILSIPFADTDRAVLTVVFHSTALRGSQFEVKVSVPFLKSGAFITRASPPIRRRGPFGAWVCYPPMICPRSKRRCFAGSASRLNGSVVHRHLVNPA